MATAAPQIAIVGSVDEQRPYDPPLREADEALRACHEIGRELSRSGYSIVVYSSDAGFIEPHVVHGYLSTGSPRPQSIHVHYSVSVGTYRFDESTDYGQAFAYHADASEDWEVSFYRSLATVDGIVILGGARSAMTAGIIAASYRLPVVAVACFGGAAQRVWRQLSAAKNVASPDELSEMASDQWDDGSAARLVAILRAQLKRLAAKRAAEASERRREERRRAATSMVSIALFAAAVATLVAGFSVSDPGSTVSFALLFGAPALAGAAGSTIRTVFAPMDDHGGTAVLALGLIAGGVATILFAAAQLSTNRDLFAPGNEGVTSYRGLLLFSFAVGFIAGFTFDLVYRRLARTDILSGGPLPAPMAEADASAQSSQ